MIWKGEKVGMEGEGRMVTSEGRKGGEKCWKERRSKVEEMRKMNR